MSTNKIFLAAAITAFFSGSVLADTVDTSWYGRANLAVATNTGTNNDELGIASDSSRVGWKGSVTNDDGLTTFAHFEMQYAADGDGNANNDLVWNRLGYVGVKGGFGEITIGKDHNPTWKQIYLRTLFFNAWSNDRGFPMGIWTEGVTYRNTFGDIKLGASLQAGTGGEDLDGYNIAVTIPVGPVSLAVGANNSDGINDDLAVSVQYKSDAMSLVATVKSLEAQTAGNDETVTILGGKFKVGDKGSFMVRYSDWKEADLSGATVGYHHSLGKGATFYLENSPADFHDSTHVGIRLDFKG